RRLTCGGPHVVEDGVRTVAHGWENYEPLAGVARWSHAWLQNLADSPGQDGTTRVGGRAFAPVTGRAAGLHGRAWTALREFKSPSHTPQTLTDLSSAPGAGPPPPASS